MATIEKYIPANVPQQASPAIRNFLDTELYRISQLLNAVTELKRTAAFFGAPGNMPITTTKNDVANWPNSASAGGEWVIDPVTGTMTIPENGVYSLAFWIYGNQGNDTKEESMRLGVRVDTTDYYLDVFSVATDKTDERAFSGTLTRRFGAGDNVTLFMDATAGMGTFAFSGGTFELVKLFD